MSTATIDESKRLTAYNMKTKKNGVPIHNAVVNRTTYNGKSNYSVKGTTADGVQALATMTSLAKAEAAFEAGTATKGTGW